MNQVRRMEVESFTRIIRLRKPKVWSIALYSCLYRSFLSLRYLKHSPSTLFSDTQCL